MKTNLLHRSFGKLIILFFALSFYGVTTLAFADKFNEESSDPTEKLDVGKIIMDHVLDSHEWHLWDGPFGTIPLPVILYSEQNGFTVFMSSKFEHGNASYQGYKINEGHIIAQDGHKFYDISITKTVTAMLISMIILCFVFISVARTYTRNPNTSPKGMQSLLEPIIIFVRDEVAKPAIGKERYEKYLPYLLTVFFFIWINNTMGLIPLFPGGANVTGNISITLVIALFTFVITTINTNKHYWIHVFNMPGVPWWLKFPIPLMPVVEFFGIISKPAVLMLRLFANITAGHIVILVFISLIFIFGEINMLAGYGVSIIAIMFSVALSFLELLVAFLQAYVFTLLSALYFGMAKVEHH